MEDREQVVETILFTLIILLPQVIDGDNLTIYLPSLLRLFVVLMCRRCGAEDSCDTSHEASVNSAINSGCRDGDVKSTNEWHKSYDEENSTLFCDHFLLLFFFDYRCAVFY
jgi:hypothetical protein